MCIRDRNILEDLDLNPTKPLILATYHPIPRDPNLTASEASAFFQALGHIAHAANIIITSPNHDGGRNAILSSIEPLISLPSVRYVESHGGRRYYSLMSCRLSGPHRTSIGRNRTSDPRCRESGANSPLGGNGLQAH